MVVKPDVRQEPLCVCIDPLMEPPFVRGTGGTGGGKVTGSSDGDVVGRDAENKTVGYCHNVRDNNAMMEMMMMMDINKNVTDSNSNSNANTTGGKNDGNDHSKEGGKPQICFDFTKGQCKRGDGCRYSHDVKYIIEVNSREKGICFDFLKGMCTRGVMCRFSHDLNNLKPMLHQAHHSNGGDVRVIGGGASGDVVIGRGGGQRKKKKRAPICYDFVKNTCAKGAACRYSHDYMSLFHQIHGEKQQGSGGHVNQASSKVCIDNLRGACQRGDGCKFQHVLPQGVVTAAGMDATCVGIQEASGVPEDTNQVKLDALLENLKVMGHGSQLRVDSERHAYDVCNSGRQLHHVGYPAEQQQHLHPPNGHEVHPAVLGTRSYPPLGIVDDAGSMKVHSAAFNASALHASPRMGELSSSPPVTQAEKLKMAQMRRRLISSDSQDGVNSPTIGAGWSHGNPIVSVEHSSRFKDEHALSLLQSQTQDLRRDAAPQQNSTKITQFDDLLAVKSIWSMGAGTEQ